MEKDKYKFKSNLVVWDTDEVPVIETFFANTPEEIHQMQEEWMQQNNYSSANMSLYQMTEDGWVKVENYQFKKMPELPKFTFMVCSLHEKDKFEIPGSCMVLQVDTGRIVRITPKHKNPVPGILNTDLIFEKDDKELVFSVAVLRLNEDDLDYLNGDDSELLKTLMMDDLFKPLGDWFKQYLEHCENLDSNYNL